MESLMGFDPIKAMKEAEKRAVEAQKVQIEILRELKAIRSLLESFKP